MGFSMSDPINIPTNKAAATSEVISSSNTRQQAASEVSPSAKSTQESSRVTSSIEYRPASIEFSAKRDFIALDNVKYLVSFPSDAKRAIATKAASFLVSNSTAANQSVLQKQQSMVSQAQTVIAAESTGVVDASKLIQKHLLAIGASVTIPLPLPLQKLISQQNDLQQLLQLSARSQGYPLPATEIINNKLTFSNGTVVSLSTLTLNDIAAKSAINKAQLNHMVTLPSIQFHNKQWLLTLKPVLGEFAVSIRTEQSSTQAVVNNAEMVIAKPELTRIYSQLFELLNKTTQQSKLHNQLQTGDKHLGQTKTSSTSLQPQSTLLTGKAEQLQAKDEVAIKSMIKPKDSFNQSLISQANPNEKKSPLKTSNEPIQHLMKDSLNKALGKAGGLPIVLTKDSQAIEPTNDTFKSVVLKLLPLLRPNPLNILGLPSTVKEELTGLMGLQQHIGSSNSLVPPQSHMQSVSLLFQLLLGIKANSGSDSSTISKKAQLYLQKLQIQMGGSTSLLKGLDKSGATESLSKLMSNLQVYSQASNDTNSQLNWFFTLPYSINQQQEHLEGHFNQNNETDDEKLKSWRLQLKFNLGYGPLLIQSVIKGEQINLTFNGSNQTLLKKIDDLLPPLISKLSDIGFTPDKIETKLAKVPATLLPGEHFLVKIKA